MEKAAKAQNFAKIFYGVKQIGGRYSVLSAFGLVPAAAMGLDVKAFLETARIMVRSSGPAVPPHNNPGVLLGTALGTAALQGRDKVTVVASPGIASFGAWAEQLIAESTGKVGKGLIPVDGEPAGVPAVYGHDRFFLYLRLDSQADPAQDAALSALERDGHPIARISLDGSSNCRRNSTAWRSPPRWPARCSASTRSTSRTSRRARSRRRSSSPRPKRAGRCPPRRPCSRTRRSPSTPTRRTPGPCRRPSTGWRPPCGAISPG